MQFGFSLASFNSEKLGRMLLFNPIMHDIGYLRIERIHGILAYLYSTKYLALPLDERELIGEWSNK
jgi:hypothetical protein